MRLVLLEEDIPAGRRHLPCRMLQNAVGFKSGMWGSALMEAEQTCRYAACDNHQQSA